MRSIELSYKTEIDGLFAKKHRRHDEFRKLTASVVVNNSLYYSQIQGTVLKIIDVYIKHTKFELPYKEEIDGYVLSLYSEDYNYAIITLQGKDDSFKVKILYRTNRFPSIEIKHFIGEELEYTVYTENLVRGTKFYRVPIEHHLILVSRISAYLDDFLEMAYIEYWRKNT